MFVKTSFDEPWLYPLDISKRNFLDDNFIGKILDQDNFPWYDYMYFLLDINLKCSDGICFIDFLKKDTIDDYKDYLNHINLVLNHEDNSP